uniref:UV-B-induced protein n=1 Tax=Davidia involucrata TaxID=16924 RepID=A0A5B6ZND1_DAVIN
MQISGVIADVSAVLSSTGGFKSLESRHFHTFSDSKFLLSAGSIRSCPSYSTLKLGIRSDKSRAKGLTVRVSGNSSGDLVPNAPLGFESPVGQLLAQILQTHPHLLPAAIDQQLENLQTEKDAQRGETPPSSQDLLLYKRIAEVKEKERQKTLEEIIYCLIVQKFLDNDISMIPKISATSDPTGRVDFWPNQEHKLESVHSPEAFEMIQSHLSLVLGERVVGPLDTIVQISKIKIGKLYAASIMYGYFLRRLARDDEHGLIFGVGNQKICGGFYGDLMR